MDNRIVATSTLTGIQVHNKEGKRIGKIEDVVIDLETGHVMYSVLSFGGFLGMGNKYFAVPVKALNSDENHKIVFDIDKDKLEEAPGFDKNDWPEHSTDKFIDSVYSHYGYERKMPRV